MLHSSTKKLIDRLAEMTELGKLDWTEGDDGNVIYSTEGYSVHLPASADEIVITSIAGKELERAAAADLAASHTEDGTSYADVVASMTKEATRIALGTETAISTLLAGMEEPAAPEIEPEPDVTVEEPEDLVNETTALAEEETVEPEPEAPVEMAVEAEPEAPEVEAEAETEAEAEVEVDASDEIAEAATEAESESEAEDTEAAMPVFGADTTEDSSEESDEPSDPIAAFALSETDGEEAEDVAAEPVEATESVAHDIAPTETESELTEAVARLADEVNGRQESEIGAAAASAVGAVALAAGLSSDTEAEAEAEPEPEVTEEPILSTEAAEPETIAPMAAVETSSSVTYIPFGTEEVETEEIAPVVATAEPAFSTEEAPETVEAEAAEPEAEAEIEAEAEAEVEAEAELEAAAEETEVETPEAEPEPETAEIVRPSFVSVASSLVKEDESASETASFGSFSSEPDPEPAPMETVASAPETVETAEPAVEAASAVEVSPEPAPEKAPQSYSLSGIGAGFGLGALSAKTEASGVPGVSDPAGTEEKIVIDATDDVLPEPEGHSNFTTTPASSNGISFGTPEKSESSAESEGETEDETDILKPRTRFNPWD